jgi:cytochrome c-type biogenesis protein CcmH/NrfF
MARYIRATHRAAVPRDYLCTACNAYGTTVVGAVGSARKRVWISEDAAASAAHDLAAAKLQADADRIVALIRCPRCGERGQSTLASVWHWSVEVVVGLSAGGFLGGIAVVEAHSWLLGSLLCAVVLGFMIFVGDERRRRKAAAEAPVVLATDAEPAPKPAPMRRAPVAVDANPFRAPPAPPPIAVIATAKATAVPVAKNAAAEAPKMLS